MGAGGESFISIDWFCFFYFSLDATFDPFELSKGRFVNDGVHEEKNCCLSVVVVAGVPHLCNFALRFIKKGEELRYDYGVPNLPWRKKVVFNLYSHFALSVPLEVHAKQTETCHCTCYIPPVFMLVSIGMRKGVKIISNLSSHFKWDWDCQEYKNS